MNHRIIRTVVLCMTCFFFPASPNHAAEFRGVSDLNRTDAVIFFLSLGNLGAQLYASIVEMNLIEASFSGNQVTVIAIETGNTDKVEFERAAYLALTQRGIPHLESQPLPFIRYSKLDKMKGSPDPIWAQDYGKIYLKKSENGEFILVGLPNGDKRGLQENLIEKVANDLDIPVEFLGVNDVSNGVLGGNVQTTPENILYVGDKAPRAFIKKLEDRFEDVIVLPSSWLDVGHVDEILSFMPSMDGIGSMMFADPIKALEILANQDPAHQPFAQLDYPDNYKYKNFLVNMTVDRLKESFSYLTNLSLDSVSRDKLSRVNVKNPRSVIDQFVMINIESAQQIWKATDIVSRRSRAAAHDSFGIPLMFVWGHDETKVVSLHPNSVNAAVINGYIKVPDPNYEPFKRETARLLSDRVGTMRVEFFDTTELNFLEGNLHCATCFIRSPDHASTVLPVLDMDQKIKAISEYNLHYNTFWSKCNTVSRNQKFQASGHF